ncbi:MAG: polysaccharide deacetylase family protein [Micromonosporaceae bacterium]
MTHRRITVVIAVCVLALGGCATAKGAPDHRATWRDTAATPSAKPSRSAKPSPSPSRDRRKPKRRTGPHGSMRTTGSDDVSLTFDDGPNPVWTPRVLKLLRSAKVKATFCLVGVEAQRHPKLVQAIVRDGHTLCNHSWDHDLRLGSRKPPAIRSNLARTNRAIHRAVPGARIAYFRQPGGRWTARSVKIARSLGMTPLHWSVDPHDWRKPPATEISRNVMRHTKKGAIVLLHDGGGDRYTTYVAVRTVLPKLKRRFHLTPL